MGKKRALIIGVNEYDNEGFDNLQFAENDAKEIYSIIVDPSIGEFDKDDVILLNNKPTRSEIEKGLTIILGQSEKNDLVFIYFAGHGKQDKLSKLCLAAKDTDNDQFVSNSVTLDYVRSIIDQSDCKRIVLIIDSCYSGAAGQSFRGDDVATKSLEEISGEGKVVITSCQAYKKARENDDLEHGIFTYYLLEGLKDGKADDNKDGFISIEELYKYVNEKVKDKTKGKQIPGKWGIDANGEIVLAKNTDRLREKETQIKDLIKEAKKLLKEEKIYDAEICWIEVIELDPENNEALQEIQQINDKKSNDLVDYYIKYQREFPAKVYDKALEILKKTYIEFNEGEKRYYYLIKEFLITELSLNNFIFTWNRMEKLEIDEVEKRKNQQKARRETQIQEDDLEPKKAEKSKKESEKIKNEDKEAKNVMMESDRRMRSKPNSQ